ncbi:MAG: YchF/TatD family DNA exonuclease [Acidobacteria bacterium]|nr:YchF/TatD family DNA exonuclease [Acidobacteriota bacterium]
MLIDSHCHLDGKLFADDRDAVLDAARAAGVGGFLTIGTGDGPPDLEPAIRVAERYDDVWATVGVHPHDAAKSEPGTLQELAALCSHPKVLAVGEIGLDYHYDHSPRGEQKRVFIEQMGVAATAGKPIIIHTREAWDDTLDLLREHWAPTGLGGVMHCFSGDLEQARASLEMGFYVSFAGMLTFGRSEELRATAAALPLERLLVETDSPYLTPVPHRKIRRNEPRFVVETARCLAGLHGVDFEQVSAATTANFHTAFKLRRPL